MSPIEKSKNPELSINAQDRVNLFSITVATINGSGSQTSNLTLLRSIFGMGIPVCGKNLFPSNIQGLPTWFTIRVNKHGYTARSESHEIVVAMNPETFLRDCDDVFPGGSFFYADDIKIVIPRTDIHLYPMPVKNILKESNTPSNLRDYLANMIYVGILAQSLGISLPGIQQALEYHFKGKKTPVELNYQMVVSAFEWAQQNLQKEDPYSLSPMEVTDNLILTDGNTAAALGSIYGGVQFISWYPITPATSLAEALTDYLPKLRKDAASGKNTFAIIQAEDELAGIGMAIGAGWAGLRAMTSTSGPGLSLMTEYIGLAYFAEVPVVIWDVQRVGPSTGLPTRTSQGDLLFSHYIGHGDTEIPLLLPGNINECFDFGWKAFDIAEQVQTPVIVLSDLDFGMNQWMANSFEYPNESMKRGKILLEEDIEKLSGNWGRYRDIDGDAITYRTFPGNMNPRSSYFARGTGHDQNASYTEDPKEWHDLLERLKMKYKQAKRWVPEPVIDFQENYSIGIISFGSTEPAIRECRDMLLAKGIGTNFLRVRAIPFVESIGDFIGKHRVNYVIEMNRDGQLYKLLIVEYPHLAQLLVSLAYTDGLPMTANRIKNMIVPREEKNNE